MKREKDSWKNLLKERKVKRRTQKEEKEITQRNLQDVLLLFSKTYIQIGFVAKSNEKRKRFEEEKLKEEFKEE